MEDCNYISKVIICARLLRKVRNHFLFSKFKKERHGMTIEYSNPQQHPTPTHSLAILLITQCKHFGTFLPQFGDFYH